MRNVLLTSVAFVFVGVTASLAAVPALDLDAPVVANVDGAFLQLAKNGSDNGGGDDNGGDDNDSDDDNSGGGSSVDDNSNDDTPVIASKRKKPRIPGGSGCDDAGDVVEHPECSPQ